MVKTPNRGFTLIELLIGLAIFAFLAVLAGPAYFDFIGNTQVRTAAENSLLGVRLAQQEALRRNALARFVFTPATGWQVDYFDDETDAFVPVQSYKFQEGASRTTQVSTPGGATTVTFNGLGRVVRNPDLPPPIDRLDFSNTNVSESARRPLRVVISDPNANAAIKLCDPDPGVATTDARACPPL
jgi:type IV fimbrial biogenesis protein FimT